MLQYLAEFRNHGMYRLDSVNRVDSQYLRQLIHMEDDVVDAFREYVDRLVRKARKGKGRELQIKEEDENEPIIIDSD